MLPLSKRTRATLHIATGFHVLHLHFAGRSLVCSRPRCPYCECERHRTRYYCAALMDSNCDLAELPPTLVNEICDKMAQDNRRDPRGMLLMLERGSVRRPWRLVKWKWVPVEAKSDRWLIERAAEVFRVDVPDNMKNWPDFADHVGQAHRPLLAKLLFPYAAEALEG